MRRRSVIWSIAATSPRWNSSTRRSLGPNRRTLPSTPSPGGEVYAALQRLQAASRDLLTATARFDALLMPVIAHPPVPVGAMDAKGIDEFVENMLDRLRLTRRLRLEALLGQLMDKSFWFTHWPAIQNVTGQPAIALPVHVTAAGLPLGVQAVGRPGDEETLFGLAAQMERLSGWLERRAPLDALP